jgi:ketosteroid isomerase-like protein
MSQENVELFWRAADAFNRRDLDAVLALCDHDIEFADFLMEMEGGGSFRGHEGVRSWWETYITVFPDVSQEIEEVRDLGDVTLVHGRTRGRVRGPGMESDAPFEQAFWLVVKGRNKEGHLVAQLPKRGRGPRSRRVAGVEDVAGERRD